MIPLKREVPSSPPKGATLDDKAAWANAYYKQERDKEATEILLAGSREVLLKSLDKKIMTATIGALHQFEQAFGYLWGQNKTSLQRNDNERAAYATWQGIRREILDNGERQKNYIRNELENYKILFKRFENDSTQRSS